MSAICIAPIISKSKYRGVDRFINFSDIKVKDNKVIKELGAMYLDYIDFDCNYDNSKNVCCYVRDILPFYLKLKENNVDCEIIIYDNIAVTDTYGYTLKFLGIDVANEFSESLISDNVKYNSFSENSYLPLNDNLLFNNVSSAKSFIEMCKNSDKKEYFKTYLNTDDCTEKNLIKYVYMVVI